MVKLKTALFLLLTLALVLLGSILPELLTETVDRLSFDQIKIQPLRPLELELNQQQESRSVVDKLQLLRNNGQIVYVGEEMMHSRRSDVEEKAARYFRDMMDQGILSGIDVEPTINTSPCMVFDLHGNQYDLFWEVGLTYYDPELENDILMDCLIDDDENRIMRFRVESFLGKTLMVDPMENMAMLVDFYSKDLGLELTVLSQGENYMDLILLDGDDRIQFSVYLKDDQVTWDEHAISSVEMFIFY